MRTAGIIVLVFFLWFGKPAFSQADKFTPEWSYGLNSGLTLSKVGFNSYINVPQESFRQFSGGATVRYISENHFGIQAELNYSMRGWKERTDTVHLNLYTRSVSYLELPFLTHIYFNLGKQIRMVFNLGPQIGLYIGEKEIEKEIVEIIEIEGKEQSVPYYDTRIQRSFDYGLKGTMGLEFRTKVGSFVLDGRYYFGLSDIFNNTKADLFQASNNQVIGVNLTYFFK